MGVWDTIADYAVPDVLVDAAKSVRDADWLGVEGAKRNKAYFERKRAERERLEKINRSKQGGLSVYRPATATNRAYDAVGSGYAGLRRALGDSEHGAAWAGHRLQDDLEGVVETMGGVAEGEKALRRIVEGGATTADYINLALTAGGDALALKGAKAVGRGIVSAARHVPEPVREAAERFTQWAEPARDAAERVRQWVAPTGPLDEAASFTHGGNEVFYPGGPEPSLRVANAPRLAPPPPRALAGPSLAARVPRTRALPAPGPGLPPEASKPRGGQFWPDKAHGGTAEDLGFRVHDRGEHANPRTRFQVQAPEGHVTGTFEDLERATASMESRAADRRYNYSPEAAVRETVLAQGLQRGGPDTLGGWLERTLPKYYKTDFGSPTDPLRDLAVRGMHYDPEMTPERWGDAVNSALMEDRIGDYTVPTPRSRYSADVDTGGTQWYKDELARREVVEQMPWLAKAPVTDKLYGIGGSGLDLDHFTNEMQNALEGRLPPDLAVRPESLSRMTFPQAAEHVGKINQFRVKEMERRALSSLEGPAIHPFKDYPENNPKGLRWVQLKQPEYTADRLPEGYELREMPNNNGGTYFSLRDIDDGGSEVGSGQTAEAAIENGRRWIEDPALKDALKYEGDTMGHCVGEYCSDVADGRSNIYSLRDAKGEPHVTIETTPSRDTSSGFGNALNEIQPGVWNDIVAHPDFYPLGAEEVTKQHFPEVWDQFNVPSIFQIKGKQNLKPKADYLPYVQDFVRSGKWSDVGDLQNADMARLPDNRYLTRGQIREGLGRQPDPEADTYLHPTYDDPQYWSPRNWDNLKHHFEGYAVGGPVRRSLAVY